MSVDYTVWESRDGLMKMMEFDPSEFREQVSTETKDLAKEKGLIHLDQSGTNPVVVVTDSPEEYGNLLERFGLEEYLRKRVRGDI